MNDPAHPPVGLLADHHEGLVTGTQAADVSTHVDSCADCRSLVAALDEVADVLGADGANSPAMPASVASSLDQALALATAERASGIPALAGRRVDDVPNATPGQRRPVWPLLAAAAVAVIATAVGAGVVLEDNGGSADSQAGADQDAPAAAGGAEDSGKQQLPFTPGLQPDFVTNRAEMRLRDLARKLDTGTREPNSLKGRCATPTGQFGDGPASLVSFAGGPAVAVLDTTTRTVTVLDCDSATTPLFATAY